MDFPPEMTISEAINRAILEAKIEMLEVMGCSGPCGERTVLVEGIDASSTLRQEVVEINAPCPRCTKLAELKGERE